MKKMTKNVYDEIPYPSLVYTDTHPGRLATLVTLFGIKPPPIVNCRVLELGCGDGTNLIAISQTLPQASLWGIDFSAKQIASGQKVISALKCPNVTLKQLDFNEIDESLGKFDYIIAHGIYSWVPVTMQDKLLSIIRRHLGANGIAYISYNVYPGWHLDNIIRDMMMYHTQQLPTTPARLSLKQAKGILQFIANLRQSGNSAYDVLLQEKWQELQTVSENYLCHDFLEADNDPVYFHQFVKHATQHDLAYVTDIEFRRYLMAAYPVELVEAFKEYFQGDFFKQEQYMDFFLNRSLRRSLLCHQNVAIKRELDLETLASYYIAANLQPITNNARWQPQESSQFKNAQGEIFTIKHSLTKAAILHLTSLYPHRITFDNLFQHICQQLPQANQDSPTLQQELLHLYGVEAIELNIEPPPYVTAIGNYPTASHFARWLSSQKQMVINLRCEIINLSPIATALLPHLNGKNDSKALRAILKKLVKKPKIKKSLGMNYLEIKLEEVLLEIAQGALLTD